MNDWPHEQGCVWSEKKGKDEVGSNWGGLLASKLCTNRYRPDKVLGGGDSLLSYVFFFVIYLVCMNIVCVYFALEKGKKKDSQSQLSNPNIGSMSKV